MSRLANAVLNQRFPTALWIISPGKLVTARICASGMLGFPKGSEMAVADEFLELLIPQPVGE
jgi:hypothetical protein